MPSQQDNNPYYLRFNELFANDEVLSAHATETLARNMTILVLNLSERERDRPAYGDLVLVSGRQTDAEKWFMCLVEIASDEVNVIIKGDDVDKQDKVVEGFSRRVNWLLWKELSVQIAWEIR